MGIGGNEQADAAAIEAISLPALENKLISRVDFQNHTNHRISDTWKQLWFDTIDNKLHLLPTTNSFSSYQKNRE